MSFLLGLIPFVATTAATVGTEVAAVAGSEIIGAAAASAVTAGAGYVADTALNKVVDVEEIKKETAKTLTAFQKIQLARSGKLDNKDIIKLLKGPEALKNTPLDEIKNRSELFVKEINQDLLNGENYEYSLNSLLEQDPVYNYFSLSLSQDATYIIPTDPEYAYVSSVYDGSVFFNGVTKERGTGGQKEFYAETERGTVSWFYPDYNRYNTIPTIWGYWTGMNSINNQLPISINGKQSLLDRIAHVHDCLYKMYGVFNKFADYVLISYINNGLKQGLFIFPGEKTKALIAINYFSSLGKMMRGLYGSNSAIYDLGVQASTEVQAPEKLIEDMPANEPLVNQLIKEVDPTSAILTLGPQELTNIVTNPGQAQNVQELISLIENLTFEMN